MGITDLTSSQKVGIMAAAGTATLLGLYAWRKSRNSVKIPSSKEYQESAKVAKLIIYPVKSLPGIEVTTLEVTKYGVKSNAIHDRQWLITKGNEGFVTQRQQPILALIKPSIHGDELHLDAQDMPTLKLTHQTNKSTRSTIAIRDVYNQKIECLDCGDEAAAWIKKYLKVDDVRFAQFIPEFEPRKMLRNFFKFPNPGAIFYQDDSAMNLLSISSVNDLNLRLAPEDQVSYRNFRPNILIDDCTAYQEDEFRFVKIHTVKMVYMEPCTRCIFTTINPETGIKNKFEPLRTLRKYRMSNDEVNRKRFGNEKESLQAMKSPRFGIYLAVQEMGNLTVGDLVYSVCKLR